MNFHNISYFRMCDDNLFISTDERFEKMKEKLFKFFSNSTTTFEFHTLKPKKKWRIKIMHKVNRPRKNRKFCQIFDSKFSTRTISKVNKLRIGINFIDGKSTRRLSIKLNTWNLDHTVLT